MRFRANNALIFLSFSVTIFIFVQFQRRTNFSTGTADFSLFKTQNRRNFSQNSEKIRPECECKSSETGIIYDFCYSLPENPSKNGKKFDCKWVEEWEKIESSKNLKLIDLQSDEVPEPVFVTAFSNPFVQNGKRLISSIRKNGLNNKIILYDLGIHESEIEDLKNKTCNLEVRKFNFSAYPKYMKNLREYRWKPIVIAETLRDFGSIWYLDSSVHLTKGQLKHVYELVLCHKNVTNRPPLLSSSARDSRERREKHEDKWNLEIWERNKKECRKGQYLLHGYSGHGILSVTHPDVYKYFPTNEGELKKPKAKMYDAGFVYAVNTRQTLMNIVKWYFLCALQEDCMAPKGAQLGCRFPGDDRFTQYSDCHRYDQSIINLVLANQFWYDRRYYVSEIVDFFQIDRTPSAGDFDNELACIL